MYEISVESHFDAAHFLRGYRGKCEALHGHRYKVVARVRATRLDDIGLAFDFTELKRHLNDILSRFDHTCLNDVKPFDADKPLRREHRRHHLSMNSRSSWRQPRSPSPASRRGNPRPDRRHLQPRLVFVWRQQVGNAVHDGIPDITPGAIQGARDHSPPPSSSTVSSSFPLHTGQTRISISSRFIA